MVIVQISVVMAFAGVSVLRLVGLFLNVLVMFLLLRGGRLGRAVWCLLVFGGVLTVIGVAWGESAVWLAAVSVVELALLLAPASRRYVWEKATLQPAADSVAR